ncbi:MAG TPA: superoxide dismutase [Candidatus Saccharibacteria bacterium]|nr:superoxide dismutase [Candidatus Saccharibacteria bacterium]
MNQKRALPTARKANSMHQLPKLEFDVAALEPHISGRIMELHHSKHHQAYITKLNAAIEGTEYEALPIEALLRQLSDIPDELQTAIRNQGGGHLNHSLFWQWLHPHGGGQPTGELAAALEKKYGSFQQFVDEFTDASMKLFGSGWCWLMPDLSIKTTANQDSPIVRGEAMPILGNDIWEHAYYLDYQNRRDEYLKAWWNVVHWDKVGELYDKS